MKREKTKEILELPRDAAMSEFGPSVSYFARGLTIRIELPASEAEPNEIQIQATGVIAFKFASESALETYISASYNCVCEVVDSSWLAEVRARGKKAHQLVGEQVRHFVLFVDHHGCLELIAESVELV